jgi:hypothetical protein
MCILKLLKNKYIISVDREEYSDLLLLERKTIS